MQSIRIERAPSDEQLESLNVSAWLTWSKKVSVFPWYYNEDETAYEPEGEVVVTPKGGEPVPIGKGDLVTFPARMYCMNPEASEGILGLS